MIPAIAIQVKEAAIAHLQAAFPNLDVRGILDQGGDEKRLAGIYVSCDDQGGFGGMPSRALVTLTLAVSCYTHLQGDMDGSGLYALVSGAADAMESLDLSGLRGYAVSLPGGYGAWSAMGESMQGSYRVSTLTTTLQLHQVPYEEESDSASASTSACASDSESF